VTHQALDLRLVLFQPDKPLEQCNYLRAIITLTPHLHSNFVSTIYSPSAKSSCSSDLRHAVHTQVILNVEYLISPSTMYHSRAALQELRMVSQSRHTISMQLQQQSIAKSGSSPHSSCDTATGQVQKDLARMSGLQR